MNRINHFLFIVLLAPVGFNSHGQSQEKKHGPFIVHREIAGQYSNYEKFVNEMHEKEMRRIGRKTRK